RPVGVKVPFRRALARPDHPAVRLTRRVRRSALARADAFWYIPGSGVVGPPRRGTPEVWRNRRHAVGAAGPGRHPVLLPQRRGRGRPDGQDVRRPRGRRRGGRGRRGRAEGYSGRGPRGVVRRPGRDGGRRRTDGRPGRRDGGAYGGGAAGGRVPPAQLW